MLAAMLYVLAAVRPAPVVVQRARCAGPVMQQREDPPKDAVMKLVGSMLFGIETAVEAAKISTDNYINSGWQVKKRAGQLMPEIRPNAVDVQKRSELLAAGAAPDRSPSASLAPPAAGGGLAQTDAELTQDFEGYLAAAAPNVPGLTISDSGEVSFSSREELSALVIGFTKQKLQALAISARALARYVSDLEAELEAADEAVVEMRRRQQQGAKRAQEAEARAAAAAAKAAAMEARLAEAGARAAAAEAAAAEEEARAEEAAGEMMRMQAALKARAAAEEEKGEGVAANESLAQERRRVVELEERLIAAEATARSGEAELARLLRQQEKVSAETKAAEARYQAEGARAAALEDKAAAAEAAAAEAAEALERKLRASELAAAEMSSVLRSLPSPDNTAPAPPDFGPGAADPRATADGAAEARAAYAELRQAVVASGGDAGRGDKGQPAAAGGGGSAEDERAVALRALSRMKKAELVSECRDRGLLADGDTPGSVAELRAVLRVERKREAMLEGMMERGFKAEAARAALEQAGWDAEAALALLVSG